ncbi:hypothetical protein HNR23_004902 [Nocardiopsis mwathae]|uniref:Uncharacterized protein n=1 Tax=Nocardiopsis mwathae TaxID=1472723 RepID=A0A7X0D7P9_9ACTN|nr:hypothetical protein [Nocardiopsis mwathae]MBB6174842.1 hypothetical protein [Nocardiopsis mwathae]
MAEQLTSPIATGGAGVVFEYRVAAVMFSRLLRGAHIPLGPQLPLTHVALQQRNDGYPFDDIVAYAEPTEESPRIQIQVKRNIQVRGQNAEFVKVMTAAADVCRTHTSEIANGSLLMGLAASAPANELAALAELTEMARAHADAEGLGSLLREGVTNKSLRTRYEHVATAVVMAANTTDDVETALLTHQILTGLHVWRVLAGPDDQEWRSELDGLSPLIAGSGGTAADIMEHLCGLAHEFGPRSGLINAEQLRRELRSRFGVRFSDPGAASTRQAARTNVVNNGAGTVIVGEHQVFHGLSIGT